MTITTELTEALSALVYFSYHQFSVIAAIKQYKVR